jgi:hypothetical protein
MKLIDILSESLDFGLINEAGLARVLSRVGGKDFIIASAYRYGNSNKENRRRNGELLNYLNTKRMGGYVLIGHWQEAPDGIEWKDADQDQLTDSIEEAILFIKPDDMSRDEFTQIGVDITNQYNQDAVLLGLNSSELDAEPEAGAPSLDNMDVYLLFKDGGREKIGTRLTLNKISQAYSQLKSKPNIPFVFEGVLHPTNNLGKQLFKIKNILYEIN